jgi:hypothetical protein
MTPCAYSNHLLLQVHQGTSLNWRCHLDAIYRLVKLRGGFYAVVESTSMEPLLLCFWLYVALLQLQFTL